MKVDSERRDPQTYAIIGAAMEVHRVLGHGFLEGVYQEAMEIELASRGIPFDPQVKLPVIYKGVPLETFYKPDFICFGCVIVELKALDAITGVEESQLLNYLKATGHERGLLLNFGTPSLQYKRMIFSVGPVATSSAKSEKSADDSSDPERC